MRSLPVLFALLCTSCCLPFGLDEPVPPPPIAVAPVVPPPVLPAARVGRASFDSVALGAVPQAPDPGALFDGAAPHDGPIERGLLVCRTQVLGGGYDDSFFAGGADIALAVRIRNGDVRMTPQSSQRAYTMPVARLAPGDAIWVRVVDIDVFVHDTVAEGATSFRRTPFSLGMGQANVECRAITGEAVELRARAALESMSRAIDELERAQPDVAAEEVGYPNERAQAVLETARGVLTWIERSDREYAAQLARVDAFDVEWSRRAAAEVNRAAQTLPARGTMAQLSAGKRLRVSRVACGEQANLLAAEIGTAMYGAAPQGCLIVVEVELSSASSIPPIDRERYLDFSAIDAGARTIPLQPAARRHHGAWIAPTETVFVQQGERVELVLPLPISADPPLLRVRDGGEPVVLRLR